MQQSFTRTALDGYLALMRPGIARTVTNWTPAQRFPFYTAVKDLLLDQAAEVFVGAPLGAESAQLSADLHDTVCGGQAIIRADVPGGTWARGLRARELGRNVFWQDALRDEVLSSEDDPTLEGLQQYPLLDAAFKEILRMYAPAGTLFRQTIKDTVVAGHYVPRASQVAINVYASMRLADWWPDPDTFDPRRFADGADATPVHRYAFAPFGGGMHKCIGQQFADMSVKAIMVQLLRQFDWQLRSGYRPRLTWGTGPTPADGLPITLRRRGPD